MVTQLQESYASFHERMNERTKLTHFLSFHEKKRIPKDDAVM